MTMISLNRNFRETATLMAGAFLTTLLLVSAATSLPIA
jgi:hypothetical protein